jgi:hypothetical protein
MIYIHDKFRLQLLLNNFDNLVSFTEKKRMFIHASPEVDKSITMINSKFR